MTESGREGRRVAIVVGSVLALVLAAALLPVITTSFRGPPGLSLVQESEVGPAGQIPGGGQLGALNPGEETTIGGLDDSASESLQALGPEVHFTVESDRPAYWRTGAFGEYTGSGWERTGSGQAYDGPLEITGMAGERVNYRVELNRTASAVPTVWRPQRISADQSFVVTDRGAIQGTGPLSTGTVIEGTSVRPPSDPSILRTAGRDYPEPISERYTQLPAETPDRLTAFTDDLTAGNVTAYETARTIENWLESNKSYSLNVSRPGDGDVASEFVFGMDRGYCEYFATSMVAMLRTQDIPARYVVGYSTGQPTGENTYTVRGMNAHAWVEVYFPEVGWVRFDPTPGGPRLSVEQAALDQQRSDAPAYNHSELGSPGEEFAPDPESVDVAEALPDGNGSLGNGTLPGGNTPERDDSNETRIPVNGSGGPLPPGLDGSGDQSPDDGGDPGGVEPPDSGPLPGDGGTAVPTVDIQLSKRPAPGAEVTVTVTYNGEPLRRASVLFNGERVGRTDFNGTVTATVPYTEELNVTVVGGDSREGGPSAAVVPPPDGRQYALPPTPVGLQDGQETNATRTYTVETNATVAVSGTVAPGQTVVVAATVGEVPVRNASVRLDDRLAGTTDENGRLTLTLPPEPGNVTLSVTRGPVRGTRELSLPEMSVDAEPVLPIALPWTQVTVTATLGNESLAGAPVSIGGETVGTTGIDGTVSASLPLSSAAPITVSRDGQSATTTIDGLLLNLGLVLGSLLAVVGSVGATARYTEMTLAQAADALSARVSRVISRVVQGLLTAVDAVLAVLSGRVSLADVRAGIPAWLSAARTAARERVRRDDAASTEGGAPPSAERAIRTAWGIFLSEVSIRDPTTKTPGELATHAIERDGLPAEPVETLRDAFRAVEYGTDRPSQRLSAVERAVESITGDDP